mgnify:FL=1
MSHQTIRSAEFTANRAWGALDMHYREQGQEHVVRLAAGDIFYADTGTEPAAYPQGKLGFWW